MFWRLWSSSRLKHATTQEWLMGWTPLAMPGGLPQHGCHSAIHGLARDTDEDHYMASPDYAQAFDRVHPVLATHALRALGIPSCTCDLLASLWEHQERHLQFMCQTWASPVSCSSSLIQGDPWSIHALNAVLLAPFLDVKIIFPHVNQYLFVDDRSLTSLCARTLLDAVRQWKDWSTRLGMAESPARSNTCTRSHMACELVALRVVPTETPKVLGVARMGSRVRKAHPNEDKRVASALATAKRCTCLALPPFQRVRFAASCAVTKSQYG